ncbi:MAG: hypothetical protein GEV04_15480 [Actinophytocola sp.]|nr:hypothetical protein [Actinophytocola sp.]
MASAGWDGTQPLAPGALYPDPTAGLVTSDADVSASAFAARYDDVEVPIAQPVEADQDAIKAMTEAVLADIEPSESGTGGSTSRQQSAQRAGAPPGMVASPQPTSARMRNALRSYPRQGNGPSLPKPTLSPKTNNSGAVIVAIVLVVIFGLIAIQVVGGIIEAISGSLD